MKELTARQGECPVCNSNNLHYGDLDVLGSQMVYWEFECQYCGAEGEEQYELKNGKTIVEQSE